MYLTDPVQEEVMGSVNHGPERSARTRQENEISGDMRRFLKYRWFSSKRPKVLNRSLP